MGEDIFEHMFNQKLIKNTLSNQGEGDYIVKQGGPPPPERTEYATYFKPVMYGDVDISFNFCI